MIQATIFDLDPTVSKNGDWHEEMLVSLGVDFGPAWPDRFGQALRDWFVNHAHHPIRTLSLFSGGGGLDIAFHQSGFEVLEMVEIEKQFAATLSANAQKNGMLDGAVVRCIDICDYAPSSDLQVDFIIGGPPCQTFSAAG